jgi:hypothetical protein
VTTAESEADYDSPRPLELLVGAVTTRNEKYRLEWRL